MAGLHLIGRDMELAVGRAGFDLLSSPGPGLCVIEGEPGIGKSALWQALVLDATGRGWQVFEARSVQAEARVSYAGFSDLFGGVQRTELMALPPVQRAALEVALLRREPTGPPPDVRGVGTAVAQLLQLLARDRPVAIAIDDVPWMDGASRRAVAFAARRLGSARVVFLLSTRENPGGPDPMGLADAVDVARATTIRLGPLTVAAIHDVVLERLDIRLQRPHLLRLHRLCRGNPFYALELARDVAESGYEAALRTDLGMAAQMARLPGLRISRLPRRTRDVLFAASAMSEATVGMLAAVVGLGDIGDDLQPATDDGITDRSGDRIRFTHPLLAAAAYASRSDDERTELHRRLSAIVRDPEERARHVALAHLEPAEQLAEIIDAGARHAAMRGAPGAAAHLAEAAVDHTPATSDIARSGRILQATIYHMEAGDLARARVLCASLVATTQAGVLRGRALSMLGQISFQQVSFIEAIDLLTQALGELGDDAGAVAAELGLNFVWNQVGDMREARRHSRAAVVRARSLGIPGLLGSALALDRITAVQAGDEIDPDSTVDMLLVADSEEPALYFMRPTFVAGVIASWEGHSTQARTPLTAMAQELIDRGQDALLPFVSLWLVGNELQLGDVDAAERYAERSLEAAEQVGDVFRAVALTALGWVKAMTGDVASVRYSTTIARDAFTTSGWRSALLWPDSTLGSLEWSLGNAAEADALLAPMIVFADEIGMLEPSLRPFVADEIEALIALGRTPEADVLTSGLERDARRVHRPRTMAVALRCRGEVLAATGHPEAGLVCLDDALTHHEQGEPLPFELARTLLARGIVERRLKRKAEARTSFERAAGLFGGLRAARWLDRTRAEQARVGSRPASVDALTETEAQVAQLAGRGMTNRQVGEALSLTPKTVEGVLSRVYAKLAIHSRAELGAWLASSTLERPAS